MSGGAKKLIAKTSPTLASWLFAPGWPAAAAPIGYASVVAFAAAPRVELAFFAAAAALAWVVGGAVRRLLVELFPAILTIIAYDAFRYARALFQSSERVLACELRRLDLALFGVGPDTTVPDFFARHHTAAVDVLMAIPYAGFIYFAAAYGAVLWFRDRQRLRVMIWAFSAMYFLAFVVWILLPAAPPWYVRANGCLIDPATAGSAAALARVDAALGISYFADFYARSPNVFGAMPSLHNAFAVMGLLVVWPIAGLRERAANLVYVAWMFLASVYLDHHWVVDAIAGWACAALAVAFAIPAARRFRPRETAPSAPAA